MSAPRPIQVFENILLAAADGILSIDLEGRIVFANPAAASLLGCCSTDELVGQPLQTYIQLQGAPTRGEQVCWRNDGSQFPIEFAATPLRQRGRLAGAVVTFRDISERRSGDDA